jgi:hypothetical protein
LRRVYGEWWSELEIFHFAERFDDLAILSHVDQIGFLYAVKIGGKLHTHSWVWITYTQHSNKSHSHMLSFANTFISAQARMPLHIEYVKNGLCVCVAKRVTA